MRVSELWLRDYLTISHNIHDLSEQLTNAGLEIDSIEKICHSNSTDHSHHILTLKIPPNRGDCLSMEGIVREIALLNKIKYKEFPIALIKPEIKDILDVKINNSEFCPRYVGRVIKGFHANIPTPQRIKDRLEWAGVRSISLIVDITNYVMLEMGQPLHAFDLDKIKGNITVRLAKKNERITLLDEKEIKLDNNILIIADEKEPMAVAGIMGGLDSAVTDTTQNIFVESAYFDPISIRLSAKRLGLMTDSSYRFERGVDTKLQIRAIERMTSLLIESAKASELKLNINSVPLQAGPIIEIVSEEKLPKNATIFLRSARIKKLLGISIEDKKIQDILRRSHLSMEKVDADSQSGFKVTPPSFRQDIHLEIDIIEEIARVLGFNQIPSIKPITALRYQNIPEKKLSNAYFKKILIDREYSETINYSFIAKKWAELLNVKDMVVLKNPLSSDMAVMRMSLLPGLLQIVQHNQRRQLVRNRLFEFGNCFLMINNGTNSSDKDNSMGQIEKSFLSGVVTGTCFKEQWGIKAIPIDFYDIKKDVENLLSTTEEPFEFKPVIHPWLHPGQSATIYKNQKKIGIIGLLHPQLIKALDLLGPIYVFELDGTQFGSVELPKFRPLSKFPAIRRDIAILVDRGVFASTLKSAIVKCTGDWLQESSIDVSLFDVYEGKNIAAGKKSIAIGLILQHPARTLVDSEVNELVSKVVGMLSIEFKATLRE